MITEPRATEFRWCVACGDDVWQQFVYAVAEHDIQRCNVCGLGSVRLSRYVDVASLYDEGYFQGQRADGYSDYRATEPVLRREFKRQISLLRQMVPAGGRILEVGCAYGFFLLEAQQYFECAGIDVSAAAVAACRERNLDVRCGSPENGGLLGSLGTFDAVVMLDVIEHLKRPDEVLRVVREVLRTGGALVITTGDWESVHSRLLGPNWRLMTPPQHLFFFSQRSLGRLLDRLGFEIVTISHPWKVVPIGLAAYQCGRRLGYRFSVLERIATLGIPLNLFDAIRVVARKR